MAKLPVFREKPDVLFRVAVRYLRQNPDATKSELAQHVADNTKDSKAAWNANLRWYADAAVDLGYISQPTFRAVRDWIKATGPAQLNAHYERIQEHLKTMPHVQLLRASIKRHVIDRDLGKIQKQLDAGEAAIAVKEGESLTMTKELRRYLRQAKGIHEGVIAQATAQGEEADEIIKRLSPRVPVE